MSGPELLAGDILWLALPIVLVAGLVHGTFGLGFPLIATPLLALVTDVRSAVLITLLPTVAVNLAILLRGGGLRLALGRHWRILPFVIVGAVLGASLLMWLDPRPFFLLLAGAILLYLNQERLQAIDFGWVRRYPGRAYILFGLTAGVMAGSVNVMVPVLIILALELGLASHAMVRLFNLNFLAAKSMQIVVFLIGGLATPDALAHTAILIAPALLALAAGTWVRNRISEQRYRVVLRMLLWLMAGILLWRFAASYAGH